MIETAERLSAGAFKICDMHIHSSSCYSRDYSKAEFFNALAGSDLDVVAVTDHNVVDVQLLSELQDVLAEKGKTLIGRAKLNAKLQPETIRRHHLKLGKNSKSKYFQP